MTASDTKAKVLVFTSNPIKDNMLSLDEEIREIKRKIRESLYPDSLELIPALAARADDFQEHLLRHRPQVVHFSGHGDKEGKIVVKGDDRQPQHVSPKALRDLFKILSDNIRLVVLNACYSDELADGVTEVVECAVGMKSTISDNAAIAFAAAFYRALGFGRSVQTAFDLGCSAIALKNLAQDEVPRLKTRSGVNASEVFIVESVVSAQPNALSQPTPGQAPSPGISSPPMGQSAQNAPDAQREIKTLEEQSDEAQGDVTGPVFASTFLSHDSSEKALVEAVAAELGCRGVLSWLDKKELVAGLNLKEALPAAIARQSTFALFLSPAAVKSAWVDFEVKAAIEKEEELGASGTILPVYIGDPELLVPAHRVLRRRWWDTATKKVTRLGIRCNETDPPEQAKVIANGLARAVYHNLGVAAADDVIIYFDHRGAGLHGGEPLLQPHLTALDAPVLVFRPNLEERSDASLLHGEEWEAARDTVRSALDIAMGDLKRTRKVHLAGAAQLGFAYLIGCHFNRTTEVELYCTGRPVPGDGGQKEPSIFTNRYWPSQSLPKEGNANCETTHQRIPKLKKRARLEVVSLLLCKEEPGFIADILDYIDASGLQAPPVWVRHRNLLTSDVEVRNYVSDVIALLGRLRAENGTRTVHLFTTLPFHAVALLAAALTLAIHTVVFMEYRRDLLGTGASPSDLYTPLRF